MGEPLTVDELKDKAERAGLRRLPGKSGYCTCQTFYDDGWWNANVANVDHAIGVYGFETEGDAVRALISVLTKRQTGVGR